MLLSIQHFHGTPSHLSKKKHGTQQVPLQGTTKHRAANKLSPCYFDIAQASPVYSAAKIGRFTNANKQLKSHYYMYVIVLSLFTHRHFE